MTHFWLRSEIRDDEFRTPLTPKGAKKLLDDGISVTVEESSGRVFPIDEYRSMGCEIAEKGAWKGSDKKTIILGLKELNNEIALSHRHIMFAHAYKEQEGSKNTLDCFNRGGGVLYDLEYLTDVSGKRVTAFGHYAGFAGAAVGLKIWLVKKDEGLNSKLRFPLNTNKTEILSILDNGLSHYKRHKKDKPRVIIIGAGGRVGRGARELFSSLFIETINWDIKETSHGGPFPEILDNDIFVNCVLASPLSKPFINEEMLTLSRKLLVISDVSCDPGSKYNTVPLYSQATSFENPYHTIMTGGGPLYITAINNLPAMLPGESSLDFERQLLTYLSDFKEDSHGVWKRAKEVFDTTVKKVLM